MKTSTLPPLRVSPELRAEAEAVLGPGETLSSFVHDAVARTIEFRKAQQAFIERGLDLDAAERALEAIEAAIRLLEHSPFSCRKAWPGDRPLLRELIVPFGTAGHVALFEIDDPRHVSILAVRHQREDDYH